MPGTRRASATSIATDNMKDASTVIKQEAGRRISTRKAAVLAEVMSEPISICGNDTDETIFSSCTSPDGEEIDESTASELGDYELNYLHTLYQPTDLLSSHITADAILPDAVAPPSLGGGMQVTIGPTPPSSHSLDLRDSMDDECESSQPSTPPRAEDAPWSSEEHEASPSSLAPSPSPRAVATKVTVGKTTGRKRKATAAILDVSPPPPKHSRAAHAHHESRHVSKEVLSDDGDDSDDCDSRGRPCPMLDGLEIRPEDDPLGLFSRDPATLTPEEQRILKKQRRLLKNRESAQLSRHRKKMHLHSLEKQVEALKKDKASLAARVQALQEDNDRLKKQLMAAV